MKLRKLAEFCQDRSYLHDSLRDRFVCSLKAENIQKRLLSEADLTLDRALEVAQAMQTAEKDETELQSLQNEAAVHKLRKGRGPSRPASKQNQPRNQKPCYRCNETNHTPDKCKFRDEICHACSKKGHRQRAYLQEKHSDLKKKLHSVDKYDDIDDEFSHFQNFHIFTLSECNSVDI